MQRRAALIHWLGLVSLVLSLFSPLITADAFAKPRDTEPDVSLIQDAASPEAPVVMEPTVGPPTEPEPTATMAPTVPPTPEPTEEPAGEPTVIPTTIPTESSTRDDAQIPDDVPANTSERSAQDSPVTMNVQGMVSINGPESASLGDTLDYTVTVLNTGSSPLTGAYTFHISFPAGSGTWSLFDDTAGGPASGCSVSSGTARCSVDGLASGASRTYTLRLTDMTSAACGASTMSAFLMEWVDGSGTYKDTATMSTTVDCGNISIAVEGWTHSQYSAFSSFDVILTNTADWDEPNVSLTAELPDLGVSWTIYNTSRCAIDGTTMTCSGLTVRADNYLPITVSAETRNRQDLCGPRTASAILTGGYTGADSFTIEFECPETTIPPTPTPSAPPVAQVSINVSAPETVGTGEFLEISWAVTNNESQAVSGIVFGGPLEEHGMDWRLSSGQNLSGCFLTDPVECPVRSLGPGDTAIVVWRARIEVNPALCGTVYTFEASIQAGGTGRDTATTTITCPPNLDISISGPDSITAGEDLTYDITVTNSGAGEATNAGFTTSLLETGGTWSIVSTTSDDALCTIEGAPGTLSCGNITLPAISGTFTARVTSTTAADPRFCSTRAVVARLPEPSEKFTYIATEIKCEPNLSITIDGPDTISPDQELSYTYTVTNTGSAPATTMELVALSPDVGSVYTFTPLDTRFQCDMVAPSYRQVTCSLGERRTLGPGESMEFHHTAQVTRTVDCGSTLEATAQMQAGGTGSDSATTTVECAPKPSISITGPEGALPGHNLTYTITVANDGTETLIDGSFSSQLPASFGGTWTLTADDIGECESTGPTRGMCSGITLAPETSATFTLQAQTTRKLACEPFTPLVELNGDYEGESSFGTTITCTPNLSIGIMAIAELAPGDPISFEFRLWNHGTGDATNGAFTATLPDTDNAWTLPEDAPDGCIIDDLLLTCTGIYVPRNNGNVPVTASSTVGTDRKVCTNLLTGATLTAPNSHSAYIFTKVLCTSGIELTMAPIQVNGESVSGEVTDLELGDVVTYQLLATNTGNSSLDNVVFTFNATDAVTCLSPAPRAVGPDATLTCEATYTITQADVDRGSVRNQANVSGTGIWDRQYSDTASAMVSTLQRPEITLDITGAYHVPTEAAPQGTIAYTFRATNNGNVTLTFAQIFETSGANMLGLTMTCSVQEDAVEQPATLTPGQTLECSAIHNVTQAQLDAGKVDASINVYTMQTNATRVELTTLLPRNPAISIESAVQNEPDAGFNRGDVATFDITMKNTGNITLTGVTVTDDNPAVEVECSIVALAPGEDADCTATATIDQDDVDAGSFTSTPSVTARSPQGTDPATVTASGSVTVGTNSTPDIGLWMSASPMPDALVQGTGVTYTLRAANTGTVTLADVEIVSDSLTNLSGLACTVNEDDVDQPVRLAPDAEIVCAATYTITSDDVDRGSVANIVSVSGLYGEDEISDDTILTIGDPATRRADVEITASASPQYGLVPGDDVTYTFTVRNIGTVTLRDMEVTADGVEGLDCGDETPIINSLSPGGASVDCTATFAVTQEFVNTSEPYLAPSIWGKTTEVNVTADAPADMNPAQVSNDASVQIGGGRSAIISLDTLVTQVDGEDVDAGELVTGLVVDQEITYSLTASNGGYMTLSDVRITDPLLGELNCADEGPITLLYQETITCEGTLTITQQMFDTDEDRKLENQGEATALDPAGDDVSNRAHYHVMLAPAAPGLTLETSVDPVTVQTPQEVTYTLTLINTGNVTLDDIAVAEHELLDVSSIDCDVDTDDDQGFPTLAPGASSSCTLSFSVTQEHIDAGDDLIVTLTATGGTEAFSGVTSNVTTSTMTIAQTPSIAITKTVIGETSDLALDAQVEYGIVVTNTGNVTLKNVSVQDATADFDCPVTASVAPGGVIECLAVSTITEEHILAGEMVNTASVTATAPSGDDVRNETATKVTTEAPSSSLALTKRAVDGEISVAPGDDMTYTFEVINTGNITVTGITIVDPMLADVGVEIPAVGDLAPGESAMVTAIYTVAATDAEVGSIVNTAIATGTDETGEAVTSPESTANVAVVQIPDLVVTTDILTPEGGAREGSELAITFTVINTGNVTLRDVELTSDLVGLEWIGDNAELASLVMMQASTGGAIGDLAPGESATLRAVYVVTRADANAGTIRLTLIASGQALNGDLVASGESEVIVEIAPPAPEPVETPEAPDPTATPVTDPTATPDADAPETPITDPTASSVADAPETAAVPVVTQLPATGSGGQGAGPGPWLMALAVAATLAMMATQGYRPKIR